MIILGIVLSYLIGSIPSGYIFCKFYKGIDIRQHGSGNMGATNVFRVLGKMPGIIVLLADAIKGLVAVVLIADLLGLTTNLDRILLALAVVSGHNWTIFLQFRGGKGIATSLGVLIGLTIKIATIRIVLLSTLIIWSVCFFLTGYVSVASITAATFLPFIMLITSQPFEIILLGIIFGIFVVLRHRSNLKRLLAGQEHRFSFPLGKKNK